MNPKPPLRNLVQTYFLKHLFVPLVLLSLLAVSMAALVQLQEISRAQKLFVKTVDRYIAVLLTGAHRTLRNMAFSAEETNKGEQAFLVSSPLEFHGVFVFQGTVENREDMPALPSLPASVDIPLSLFPDLQEWPALSVPYFSARLKTLTLSVLVRADRYVAVGELNLENLERLIRDFLESAPENVVLVLDPFGNVIYHPDPRLMRSQENLSHEPLVKRALSTWQPGFLVGALDHRLMVAYTWRVTPWNWILVVGKPVVETLLPPLLWAVGGVLFLFLAVFSVLIAFKRNIDRIIVQPIMHLKDQWDGFARHKKPDGILKAAEASPFMELQLFANELQRSSQAVLEREKALIAQSSVLHRILESIEDGVIVTDVSGRIVRMNAKAELITGWWCPQALGRPAQRILTIVDSKTKKPVPSLDQLVLASGTPHHLPGYGLLFGADGSLVVVTHSAAPFRDDRGTIQGVVMVLRDATVEYEAQKRLEESERKYRQIMETMDEAYMELEPNGRVSFCNPATLKILACSWEELQKRTYLDFTDEQTAQKMRAFFSEIFASGSSLGLQDFTIHDTQGRRKTVEISAGVRRDEEGRKIGFRVLARDITEKTEALERSRNLERMLAQTQKMESLGTLASGIAHEFNNLLQAMSGYLEMALRRTDPEDPRSRWLSRVQEASFKARDLIRRLLSFARQTEPVPEPMSLNVVVQETLDLLQKSIPRMIEIEKDLEEDLPILAADRLQVEQVIINLIANARDAIGVDNPGTIRVRTRSHKDEKGQVWLRLEVEDTGAGIPEDIRDRIFDPFFTTKGPGKGTGLGLSTVYGIVANHEGRVFCESRPGQGTTFTVDFPVKPWALQEPPLEVEPVPQDHEPVGLGARLLVVDDEPMLLELVQGMLEAEGYKVDTADSGEEALNFLARNNGSVDVLILDLSMPGMGGRRCLEILKAQHPHIPVLVASGDTAHEIFRHPEKFGAGGCIMKPYRLRDLTHALQKLLTEKRGAADKGTDGA
ncbi:MAG: PAS domain S-box protein [Desulfosoma sp.]